MPLVSHLKPTPDRKIKLAAPVRLEVLRAIRDTDTSKTLIERYMDARTENPERPG